MWKFWNLASLLSESLVVRVGGSFSQTASHLTWVQTATNILARWLAERLEASRQHFLLVLNHSGKSVRKERRVQQGRLVRNVCIEQE